MGKRKAAATAATAAATATPAVVQAAPAGTQQGKHVATATRTAKLAIVARSLRGINRNLRLQGHAALTVRKVKGKGLLVFRGNAKTGKVVVHAGNAVANVRQLTYGQWVSAAVASAGK